MPGRDVLQLLQGSLPSIFYTQLIDMTVAKYHSKQRRSNWPTESFCPILISTDEVHILYLRRVEDVGCRYTLCSLGHGGSFPRDSPSYSTVLPRRKMLQTLCAEETMNDIFQRAPL